MVKFQGRILQFGFGAVGKSFFEKIKYEIDFDEYNYYVLTRDKGEFKAFINLGGIAANFKVAELTEDNYKDIFGSILKEGDLLIDFADSVGTRDILKWCAENNIMYINTGEADWPSEWYCIFEENGKKCLMKKEYASLKVPMVLQHGNNPGLVSHFVKAALEYIVENQFKGNKATYKELVSLLKKNEYNQLARKLGLRMLHVNDIDLQKVKDPYKDKKLYNTWCAETFLYELLSETAYNIGTHEKLEFNRNCLMKDKEKGYLKLEDIAVNVKCNTIYPGGTFEGFVVPHEETITIAKSLEVREEDIMYRPTVMFVYAPCEYATKYLLEAKVNDYPNPDPNKPQDFDGTNENTIVRGHEYPREIELLYIEKISEGTEYVALAMWE
jgi:homospermidine synthase